MQIIQYQEQSNLALTLLVKSQKLDKPPDINKLVCYPLTPVPYNLGTPDGYFAKTNKAALLHYLLKDYKEEEQFPKDVIHIQDGNALFYMLRNLAPTFAGICLQILEIMAQKKNFIFSTDCYDKVSIKNQERMRRGSCPPQIVSEITTKPIDFKLFLSN